MSVSDRFPDHHGGAPLLGVDGCRGGWFAVLATHDGAHLEPLLLPRFADVLALRPRPRFVAVDMPIGLPARRATGGRACEREARALLGPRRSSVFSTPARDVLHCRSWADVRGRGISKQAFHLLPKIREIDALITPGLQRRVRETHPELVFRHLAGRPLRHAKRTQLGKAERLQLLTPHLPGARRLLATSLERHPRSRVASDDVIDALVLVVAAQRMLRAEALRLPPVTVAAPRDPCGLQMVIWA
ncbi:MAG: DUF429 domain-containing protein [bacterium]|nr:DUF429 domain-containing protein [bacterium]